MKPAILLGLGLALLARAQSNATNSSQSVATVSSLTTFTVLGPNRQLSTVTSTIVSLSTAAPTQSASSNGTVSGNSTVSGNNTVSANNTASASTSTSAVILPTAPTTVAAGGGPNGAPLPGASGAANGPDDKYIAAASSLAKNSILVGVGLLLSGALIVL